MSAQSSRMIRSIRRALPIAALAALYLFHLWAEIAQARRSLGLSFTRGRTTLEIGRLWPGLPAERDGLAVGDLVVSVDGAAPPSRAAFERMARSFAGRERVRFEVEREGQRLFVDLRPGVPIPWSGLAFEGLTFLGYLGLAWLVGRQARGDARARLLQIFALSVAFELALPFGLLGRAVLDRAIGILSNLLTGVQFGLELHLAALIPERPRWLERRRFIVPLLYLAGLLIGGGTAIAHLLGAVGLAPPGILMALRSAAWERTYDVFFFSWALLLVVLLGRQAMRYPEARGRHQAGLVLLGALPWIAAVTLELYQGFAGQEAYDWQSNDPLLLLPYPIAVFIAISRHRLFDLQLVVRRSMIYTALTTILLVVFFLALGAGGALFSHVVGGSRDSVWVVSAATLVLGLLFSPLRQALQRLIDRRFFPERGVIRQRLIDLAAELPAFGKLPLMGQHLVTRMAEIFDVRGVHLLLVIPPEGHLQLLASSAVDAEADLAQTFVAAPHEPGLDQLFRVGKPRAMSQLVARSPALAQRLGVLESDLAVPLRSHERPVGLLLLGRRGEAGAYSSEESELLSLLGHHLASVLENARLFESATYESLTGLLRREAILELLEREFARAMRHGRPLAIAMLDLDHFKEINDRYGHLNGDLVLRRVAQVLRAELRVADAVGRFGGEEFLVVLPESDLKSAQVVAEKLRRAVAALTVPLDEGGDARVTTSIGLAATEPPEATAPSSMSDLVALADRRLYAAKSAGRDRVAPAGVGGDDSPGAAAAGS